MRRSVTVNEYPKIELALRELEDMIADVENQDTAISTSSESVVVTSSNHTMGDENAVYVNTDGGNRNVYLESSPVTGRLYKVANRGSNQITVNGYGRKINGDNTLLIAYENSTAQLQFTGTEWAII